MLPPGPALPALAQTVAYQRDPRASPRSLFGVDGEEHGALRAELEPLARAELRAVLPLVPPMRAVWPRAERMVIRGTVLVPHRGAIVTLREAR